MQETLDEAIDAAPLPPDTRFSLTVKGAQAIGWKWIRFSHPPVCCDICGYPTPCGRHDDDDEPF